MSICSLMKKNNGHKLEEQFIEEIKNGNSSDSIAQIKKVFDHLKIEIKDVCSVTKNLDSDAKNGRVEDVTIVTVNNQKIRFSLKKNNKVIRHSRPQNILRDEDYRNVVVSKNNEIIKKISDAYKETSIIKISQLSKKEKYAMYEEIRDYVFFQLQKKINAQELFQYLLGTSGYCLLTYKTKHIELKRIDYEIPNDLSVKIERYQHNKIMFYFSNGCSYEYRIKTEGQTGIESIADERFKGEFKIEKDIFSVEIIK